MDVTLSSSAVIPYLDRGYIEEYANLNFYSDKGEVVKMNLVVLAALRSSLANSLTDADFEDCCVLTEFSKSELDEVNNFIWTGKCQLSLAGNVFAALGINVHALSEPFPTIFSSKMPKEVKPDVKFEVKDEPLALSDDDVWGEPLPILDDDMPLSDLPLLPKKKGKKRRIKVINVFLLQNIFFFCIMAIFEMGEIYQLLPFELFLVMSIFLAFDQS